MCLIPQEILARLLLHLYGYVSCLLDTGVAAVPGLMAFSDVPPPFATCMFGCLHGWILHCDKSTDPPRMTTAWVIHAEDAQGIVPVNSKGHHLTGNHAYYCTFDLLTALNTQ